ADCHLLIFQRLSQYFQNTAVEFGQLIQKQDTLMSERDFAWTWQRTTANQTGIADGVMRRPKWPVRHQPGTTREAGHRMNLRQFQRGLELQGWQNRRQSLGQHGLA